MSNYMMMMIIIASTWCTRKAGKWYWDEYSMILAIFSLQSRRQKKGRRKGLQKAERNRDDNPEHDSMWETMTLYF